MPDPKPGEVSVQIHAPEFTMPKTPEGSCWFCGGERRVEFVDGETGRVGVYDPCPECEGERFEREVEEGG